MMSERIKILHVEDDDVDHMTVMRLIKNGDLPYDMDRAASVSEAIRKAETGTYDLALLDYNLPDGCGLDFLDKVKNIPVIFLTGSGDPSVAVNAMKGGAYDYLIKDKGFIELLPVSVEKTLQKVRLERNHIEMEELIVRQNRELEAKNIELSRLYEETKFRSLHDPLTGIGNRRFMEAMMERSFVEAKRYDHPLSVIMFDIDHFKQYNDTHGHNMGDRTLKLTAKIVSDEVRHADSAFRYGGEEFLILLPETSLKNASDLAERLRGAVEAGAGVTISLGVSTLNKDMQGADELVKKADEALYRAKDKGRNRVEMAEQEKHLSTKGTTRGVYALQGAKERIDKNS